MKKITCATPVFYLCLFFLLSCKTNNKTPAKETISSINLKRGKLISCGPPGKEFGEVNFNTSCPEKVKADFDLAIALLHSFEYDEAEKVFARIIDKQPDCAMAYWGVAMSNYHPLWEPPNAADLEKGTRVIAIAKALTQKTKMETEFIDALELFYKDRDVLDHHTRSINYQHAMEKVYKENPQNKEAAIFYSLALIATANPADKSFSNQKKAGDILGALYPGEPNHPGIIHYIIHAYDFPGLAQLALPAARHYASIAPSSAHAQHMPAHIFVRLGLWEECIQSSLASTSSARCYAENAGIQGHWDEELHGMDYLVYAYLQKGANKPAKQQWDYLKTIHEVYPVNFKDAYAFASIPSRYLLENRLWKEAASLQLRPENFPWQKFTWQKAIIHFTRLLGAVNTGSLHSAKIELKNLENIYDTLTNQGDPYKANQVLIQAKTGKAWILFKQGKQAEAISLMTVAADMEDKTEKHPVTPGEVLPARELLGDMYFQSNQPKEALTAYETSLKKRPNRFNGLYGAGSASEKMKDPQKASFYYRQLTTIAGSTEEKRAELETARIFLKNSNPEKR